MYTSITRSGKPSQTYPRVRIDPVTWGLRIEWPDINVKVILVPGGEEMEARGSGITVVLNRGADYGYWVRVFGRTYPLRQKLRAAGLHWSPRWREWARFCRSLEEAMEYFVKVVNEVM